MHEKAFNIARNPDYNGYQGELASIAYRLFDTETSGNGIKIKNISSKELAEQKNYTNQLLETLIIEKVQSPFIENILVADLADMQLISILNWLFRFLLCVIDIYSKYAWVIH